MMMLAMLRVAALTFWRDKAGLVLAFLLPPIVFLVFASIFAGGASGAIDVHAGVVDQVGSAQSRLLVRAMRARLGGRLTAAPTTAALEAQVANGAEDAGLIIHGNLTSDSSPITVLFHPGKRAAGEVLAAHALASANAALPGLMLNRDAARLQPVVSFTDEQRARLRSATAAGLRTGPMDFINRRAVGAASDPVVVYYAGAVSILFVMFTAMQGAVGHIEERRSGIQQRLALSAGGMAPIVGARMAWLTALGFVQSLGVFLVAALVYHTPLAARLAPWAVTATAAAASCAGLALVLAAACRTREQAQTVSTFAILMLGAVGGSMAPRFLMPASLQALGWFTPNAWAIDAYQSILWRQVVDARALTAWAALAGFALAGFVAALAIEHRRRA